MRLERAHARAVGRAHVVHAVHVAIMAVAAEQGVGLGKVAQPIRVAVSGGTVSPPIDVTLEILGRETTLGRLDRAAAAIPPARG